MAAKVLRSEQGGLADVMHDSTFKLHDANPSYLFMDTSALFEAESQSAGSYR